MAIATRSVVAFTAAANAFLISNAAFLNPSLPSPFHPLSSPKYTFIPRDALGNISGLNSPLCMSNVGDGSGNGNGNGNDGNNGNNENNDEEGGLDDFLNPQKADESENLKRARAALSDTSLPINFDQLDIDNIDESQSESAKEFSNETDDNSVSESIEESEELVGSESESSGSEPPGILAPVNGTTLANNDYLNVVSKLSPSDLISKFTSTAHPRVQDAVRSTILGLIGTLPQLAFETTTITTGERLASLMFQLQMTGYMFKNAEYRLSLSQSLGIDERLGKNLLDAEEGSIDDDDGDDDDQPFSTDTKIKGKIKVRYQKKAEIDDNKDSKGDPQDGDEKSPQDDSSSGAAMEVEVDAAAYMAELRNEVSKLREDLSSTRKAKEESIRKDLLAYIRTLPQQELNTLTNSMTDDVLDAMKGLVNSVMGGIGEGQIDKNTVTEQSGEAMAQLCMWQLVVGYNLRELEVREEMKNALTIKNAENGVIQDDDTNDLDGSIDYGGGGFE